jgi:hypothetical protein
MQDPKALALFQEILKKTEAGKLAWDATAEEDKFVAIVLGRYTVTLVPYTIGDRFGERHESPSLTLQDEKQNIIVLIHSNIEGVTDDALQQLQVLARRSALHADEKIDQILEELKRPDLTIIKARYGMGTLWHDVTSQLRTKIRSETINLIVSNQELGVDPAPDVVKNLVVEYTVGNQTPQSRTVAENHVLTLP